MLILDRNQVNSRPLSSNNLVFCYIASCISPSQVPAPDIREGMRALSHKTLAAKSPPMACMSKSSISCLTSMAAPLILPAHLNLPPPQKKKKICMSWNFTKMFNPVGREGPGDHVHRETWSCRSNRHRHRIFNGYSLTASWQTCQNCFFIWSEKGLGRVMLLYCQDLTRHVTCHVTSGDSKTTGHAYNVQFEWVGKSKKGRLEWTREGKSELK